MPLVAAKCTSCGSNIQVDSGKDAGVCEHCGTAYITEKAITNYNISNTFNTTQNIVKNIYGNEKQEAADLILAGEKLLQLKDYDKAQKQFERATELDPGNPYAWFGIAKALSKNLQEGNFDSQKYYVNALEVANETQKTDIKAQYAPAQAAHDAVIEKWAADERNERRRNYKSANRGGLKFLIFSSIVHGSITLFALILMILGVAGFISSFYSFISIALALGLLILSLIVMSMERQQGYYLQTLRKATYIIIWVTPAITIICGFIGAASGLF